MQLERYCINILLQHSSWEDSCTILENPKLRTIMKENCPTSTVKNGEWRTKLQCKEINSHMKNPKPWILKGRAYMGKLLENNCLRIKFWCLCQPYFQYSSHQAIVGNGFCQIMKKITQFLKHDKNCELNEHLYFCDIEMKLFHEHLCCEQCLEASYQVYDSEREGWYVKGAGGLVLWLQLSASFYRNASVDTLLWDNSTKYPTQGLELFQDLCLKWVALFFLIIINVYMKVKR